MTAVSQRRFVKKIVKQAGCLQGLREENNTSARGDFSVNVPNELEVTLSGAGSEFLDFCLRVLR
ncbi:MAG: hypothetical protein LBU39_01175 [Desulfobulbaceae bacterium]|jgi:hypothetical protein|nr:hypothetical protein [Desulfobulbaceae bacterium]